MNVNASTYAATLCVNSLRIQTKNHLCFNSCEISVRQVKMSLSKMAEGRTCENTFVKICRSKIKDRQATFDFC